MKYALIKPECWKIGLKLVCVLAGARHFVQAAILLGSLSGFAQAVPGENMHFYGSLVAEPCVIPPGEEKVQLNFGTVIDKYLYQYGRTQGQPFDIHLTECDITLGNTVSITFVGTESTILPGLLAPDMNSTAKGIAIGLETQTSAPLPFNIKSQAIKLTAGDNRIALKAYVQGELAAIASRSIVPGTFNATATFSLEYE